MRKAIVVIAACLLLAAATAPPAYAQNAAHKLGRGMANIVTGWLEVPWEIARKTQDKGDIAGIFVAPVTGFFKACGRTIVGFYDVVTCVIPFPRGYEPVIEPEFVFG